MGARARRGTLYSIFHFPEALSRDPAVEGWLSARSGVLGEMARRWFEVLRDCGEDVRELLHDHRPTACVGNAAFAYVDVFSAHVGVGFYRGAELDDPAGLLVGSGKRMCHVKLRPNETLDEGALLALIAHAYTDMRARVAAG